MSPLGAHVIPKIYHCCYILYCFKSVYVPPHSDSCKDITLIVYDLTQQSVILLHIYNLERVWFHTESAEHPFKCRILLAQSEETDLIFWQKECQRILQGGDPFKSLESSMRSWALIGLSWHYWSEWIHPETELPPKSFPASISTVDFSHIITHRFNAQRKSGLKSVRF